LQRHCPTPRFNLSHFAWRIFGRSLSPAGRGRANAVSEGEGDRIVQNRRSPSPLTCLAPIGARHLLPTGEREDCGGAPL
jgi:hypothetical protein